MDIVELDQESAELLPDRQALGCWNHGWCGGGYTDLSLRLNLSLNLNLGSGNGGW